jgi:hypothetical protein
VRRLSNLRPFNGILHHFFYRLAFKQIAIHSLHRINTGLDTAFGEGEPGSPFLNRKVNVCSTQLP